MEPVSIGIIGIGGYGQTYMRTIDVIEREGIGKLTAAVIRNRPKYAEELEPLEKERGVRVYPTLGEMLAAEGDALEIVAIPTGISTHRPLMIEAVEAGKDVILEKPPAGTIQDIDAMLAALDRTGRFCQVGFQSQGNPTVLGLKRLVCDGKLGAIERVTVKGTWVRRDSYYTRNPWAGRIKTDDGWALDGTVNNPMAHYLMNALFFAGPRGACARPLTVQAELYHAHDIESEDTSCVRVTTAEGPTVLFLGTLAANENKPIEIVVEGTKGRAVWPSAGDVAVEYADGATGVVKQPEDETDYRHDVFRNAIGMLRGKDDALNCPLSMTRHFMLAMNGAWLSAGVPKPIAAEHLKIYHDDQTDSRGIEIEGINAAIDRAAEEQTLYAEMGLPWAEPREPVSVENLTEFDLPLD